MGNNKLSFEDANTLNAIRGLIRGLGLYYLDSQLYYIEKKILAAIKENEEINNGKEDKKEI